VVAAEEVLGSSSGHGVMALTVVGGDPFPSFGYALINAAGRAPST
jgi:hypothetical protein